MTLLPLPTPPAPPASARPITVRGRRPGDRRVRIERQRQPGLARRVTSLVHRILGA